jgi:isocitrate dehydrogenase (NAD+)
MLAIFVFSSSPSSYLRVQVPIQWEEVSVTPILKGGKTVIPDSAIASVKKNTVALKGEYYTKSSPNLLY